MRRVCPVCGGTSVITFDADEDWCTQCKSRFPGISTVPDKCVDCVLADGAWRNRAEHAETALTSLRQQLDAANRLNERHSDASFKPDWAGYRQHQAERDELKQRAEAAEAKLGELKRERDTALEAIRVQRNAVKSLQMGYGNGYVDGLAGTKAGKDIATLNALLISERESRKTDNADLTEQVIAAEARAERYREASDVFCRVYRLNEPLGILDSVPLRDILPGAWVTWGDLKKLARAALADDTTTKETP